MGIASTLALCVLAQLAPSAPAAGPVPGVEGSSTATLPAKPPGKVAEERPTFYRRKMPPPPVPEAAAAADLRGLEALKAGDCAAAIAAYDEALALAPGTASYLFNRGQCLARVGRLDDALRDLDAAVKRDPELPPVGEARFHVRIMRGGGRLEAGDAAGALEDFREARRLDPRSGLAWSEEAVALAQLARPKECVEAATRALRFAPRRVEALGTRAACLARLGRRVEALEDLSAAISIAPRGEVYASRAFMHLESGHVGPAKRDAREAVRLDPRLEPMMQQVLDAGP